MIKNSLPLHLAQLVFTNFLLSFKEKLFSLLQKKVLGKKMEDALFSVLNQDSMMPITQKALKSVRKKKRKEIGRNNTSVPIPQSVTKNISTSYNSLVKNENNSKQFQLLFTSLLYKKLYQDLSYNKITINDIPSDAYRTLEDAYPNARPTKAHQKIEHGIGGRHKDFINIMTHHLFKEFEKDFSQYFAKLISFPAWKSKITKNNPKKLTQTIIEQKKGLKNLFLGLMTLKTHFILLRGLSLSGVEEKYLSFINYHMESAFMEVEKKYKNFNWESYHETKSQNKKKKPQHSRHTGINKTPQRKRLFSTNEDISIFNHNVSAYIDILISHTNNINSAGRRIIKRHVTLAYQGSKPIDFFYIEYALEKLGISFRRDWKNAQKQSGRYGFVQVVEDQKGDDVDAETGTIDIASSSETTDRLDSANGGEDKSKDETAPHFDIERDASLLVSDIDIMMALGENYVFEDEKKFYKQLSKFTKNLRQKEQMKNILLQKIQTDERTARPNKHYFIGMYNFGQSVRLVRKSRTIEFVGVHKDYDKIYTAGGNNKYYRNV